MSLGCEEPAQHTLSISLHGGGFYLIFFFSGFVWDLCVARFVVCSRAGNLRGSEDPFQGGLAGIKCSDPRALCFPSFNHPQSCQLLSAGMSSQLSVLPIPIFLPDPKSLKVPVGPGWPHNR